MIQFSSLVYQEQYNIFKAYNLLWLKAKISPLCDMDNWRDFKRSILKIQQVTKNEIISHFYIFYLTALKKPPRWTMYVYLEY